MPKEPTSVCPFCFPFYPLSQRILLSSRLKHCFWDYTRPVLPSTRTCSAATGFVPGLSSLPPMPAADCPPPCGHRSLCRKARASHRRQSIAAIKVQTGCSSGSKRENQAIKKAPAVRRMPCFVSWEFPVTCGFIPGSGGFPECSAQHRTVRRRAAVKSAAEEAAHHRSKWRCPDQAGMPSVRWQWLYGAGH